MAKRMIDIEIWGDSKFTDDFTPEDKYFWLFLLTTRYGSLSGCFEITPNQIAKDMGYSKESAENLIYRFSQTYNMISYDKDTKEVLIHNWYRYNWTKSPLLEKSLYKDIDKIKSDNLRRTVVNIYDNFRNGDTVSIPYQYPTISISNSLSNSYISILEYLNLKSKKNYKDVNSNIKFIKARMEEGYTEEDLKKVIDVKTEEWLGTDSEKYLRPETLFNQTKFQTYINQKPKEQEVRKQRGTVI